MSHNDLGQSPKAGGKNGLLSALFRPFVEYAEEIKDWYEASRDDLDFTRDQQEERRQRTIANGYSAAYHNASDTSPEAILKRIKKSMENPDHKELYTQFGKITLKDFSKYHDNLTGEKKAELEKSRREYQAEKSGVTLEV